MDDLSDLDDEFQERLENYFGLNRRYNEDYAETIMAIKEAMWDDVHPQPAPLDDPWFWPDDQQPIPREKSNDELDPFWR